MNEEIEKKKNNTHTEATREWKKTRLPRIKNRKKNTKYMKRNCEKDDENPVHASFG